MFSFLNKRSRNIAAPLGDEDGAPAAAATIATAEDARSDRAEDAARDPGAGLLSANWVESPSPSATAASNAAAVANTATAGLEATPGQASRGAGMTQVAAVAAPTPQLLADGAAATPDAAQARGVRSPADHETQILSHTDGSSKDIALGHIAWVAMHSRRHRTMSLVELKARVLPALLHDQYIVVGRASQPGGLRTPVAAVLWANVSDEVNARLANAGQGEHRLSREDWTSGPHTWIIDVIGEEPVLPVALRLLRMSRLKGRPVRMLSRSGSGSIEVREVLPG